MALQGHKELGSKIPPSTEGKGSGLGDSASGQNSGWNLSGAGSPGPLPVLEAPSLLTKPRHANTAYDNCGIFQMFTFNKLMLLAHTEIAKQCNYGIHKKIIGFIKIINCWHAMGRGVQQ